MIKDQTYLCATASGDRTYLQWLRERLIYQYSESPCVDFVQTLVTFDQYFAHRHAVPRWLNWLLRRYGL